MLLNHYAYIALDIARERTLEAEMYHRYADALGRPAGPGLARRSVARAAAGLSRASASLARRLDSAVETEPIAGRSTVS